MSEKITEIKCKIEECPLSDNENIVDVITSLNSGAKLSGLCLEVASKENQKELDSFVRGEAIREALEKSGAMSCMRRQSLEGSEPK